MLGRVLADKKVERGGGVLIGELADRLGLNTRTIRYYESIELLPEPERSTSGYRVYDEGDVDRLGFIKSAQRLGLALDEIREVLAFRDRGEAPCEYVSGLITKEVTDIDRRLKELRHLRRELVALKARAGEVDGRSGRICGLIEHVRQRSG
jgi:DNA-binding transcriptional MerR regulator